MKVYTDKEKQMRTAIALFCGWKYAGMGIWISPRGVECHGTAEAILPDYLSDLNATHDAELRLDGNQRIQYACYLTEPVRDHIYEVTPNDLNYTVCFLAIHSSAYPRAVALFRTIEQK
jgi:hypothetical protein